MYGQPLPNTTSSFTHELITATWTFWKLARAYPPLLNCSLDFAPRPDVVICWAWKWASRTSDSQIVPRTGDGALELKHKLPNHTGHLLFSQTDNLLTSSRFHTRSPAGCKPQGPSIPPKTGCPAPETHPATQPQGHPSALLPAAGAWGWQRQTRRAPSTELSGHRQPCSQPHPSRQEGNKSGKKETKWLRWLFALFPPPSPLSLISLATCG